MVLEHLEEELLGDHDDDHIPQGDMPPPSIRNVPDSSILPLSSQRPLLCGGHSTVRHVP
jgi:hypothetical protein